MKLFLLFLVFLCLVACAKEGKTKYVQQQELNVAPPKVHATNTLIDSSVILTADLRLDGVEIFYTTNGKAPTKTAQKYERPLKVENEGVFKFKAFHPDWKPSETTLMKLYKKGYKPSKISWFTNAHDSYPGFGNTTVINENKGTLDFRDRQWQGFDSIAKSKLYFDKSPFIKSITIGYLIDTKSWIFPPKKIELHLNHKDTIAIKMAPLAEKEIKKLEDVQILIDSKVDSITIIVHNTSELPEWHLGTGKSAWLFMDEWIFN